jgi:hypothetical protein
LTDDRIAHATVDVDEVAWAYPLPILAQRREHLRAWCEPHGRAGHDLRKRIVAREPPGWSGLAYLLEYTERLHVSLRSSTTRTCRRLRIKGRAAPAAGRPRHLS